MLRNIMPAPSDWEALARARGFDMAPEQLDRVVEPLRALEKRFRPLAADLSFDLDPATTFWADPEFGE
jgi:hypothetical protein